MESELSFDSKDSAVDLLGPFIFEAAGSKAEGRISYNYRFHIVTRFTPNNRCNFFSMLAVKFVG